MWFGAFVLLIICISVYGVAGRASLKVEVTNGNGIGRRRVSTVWTSGSAGHKSSKDARILLQLKESGPSPGIGH